MLAWVAVAAVRRSVKKSLHWVAGKCPATGLWVARVEVGEEHVIR